MVHNRKKSVSSQHKKSRR